MILGRLMEKLGFLVQGSKNLVFQFELLNYFDPDPIFTSKNYNQLHSILRLFNVLQNLPFTTSETMGDY